VFMAVCMDRRRADQASGYLTVIYISFLVHS
jgi:hypothetical protein